MKYPLVLAALAMIPTVARAGLYYSGETFADLPAQWRGVLLDQRELRMAAAKPLPGLPPSPLRTAYRDALARLEKIEKPTADEIADLGALYVRTGQPARAVEVLRPAQRRHPDQFRLAANLGTAWQMHGDLDQAAEYLRTAVRLAPEKFKSAEVLHLKLVIARKKNGQNLDDLFGSRFVGDKGEWVPGTIADAERKKLPADAVADVQRLALWFPADARLLWQMAELANAHGDVRTAASMFEGLVSDFGMTAAELRLRRQTLRGLVEKLPPASRTDDGGHGDHTKLTFRSPRPLVRRFDASSLPAPAADRANPLPWALLGETTVDARFRATFPDYVKKVDGKPVALTGFMQPLGDAFEVSSFLLIEYPVGCWFCEVPPTTGMLLVELPENKAVTIKRGLVKVEGVLKLNSTDPEDFLFTLKDAKVIEPD